MGNVDIEPRVHVFAARGARWKRLRTISSPSFNVVNLKKVKLKKSQKIKFQIMPTVEDSVNVMMDHLKKAAESDQPFNVHP